MAKIFVQLWYEIYFLHLVYVVWSNLDDEVEEDFILEQVERTTHVYRAGELI